MKILIAGGTGFIGQALLEKLTRKGYEVTVISRHPENKNSGPVQFAGWNDAAQAVEGKDAVINLTGEPVAEHRWTADQKKKIRTSRIDTTRILVEGIAKAQKKPSVLINASAIGYYGNVADGDVSESHAQGKGFLAETCAAWEAEARKAESFGLRVVLLRIGIVLEKSGGALRKLLPPFHFYAGGPLGSGKQWVSWIHREDVLGIILFALEHSLSGPVNAAAPEAVTMKDFSGILGRALDRPSWLPAPEFALKLLLGERAEILLNGQKAVPQKLQTSGYPFRYPKLETALQSILKS